MCNMFCILLNKKTQQRICFVCPFEASRHDNLKKDHSNIWLIYKVDIAVLANKNKTQTYQLCQNVLQWFYTRVKKESLCSQLFECRINL